MSKEDIVNQKIPTITKLLWGLVFIFVVFCAAFYNTVRNHKTLPVAKTYYGKLNQKAFNLANDPQINYFSLEDLLIKSTRNLDAWPVEYWRSITSSDARGEITVFHNAMIAFTWSMHRLWEGGKASTEIMDETNRLIHIRKALWHGFPWESKYISEYIMLSALAYKTGSKKLEGFQSVLYEALNQYFSPEGSPHEGVRYGIMLVKNLIPYFEMTHDQKAGKATDNFLRWLSGVTDPDGWIPAWDDSKIERWPFPLTDIEELRQKQDQLWYTELQKKDYLGKNESVIKRPEYTFWIRHKEQLKGLLAHQHFSYGEVNWKS
ncbi:MAG: hypothetical protein KC713_05450, partial [Candidatus Omnitrophica bacterium]|nr:hypothetical protein [Candidatus Omnitrophota bacterium]